MQEREEGSEEELRKSRKTGGERYRGIEKRKGDATGCAREREGKRG